MKRMKVRSYIATGFMFTQTKGAIAQIFCFRFGIIVKYPSQRLIPLDNSLCNMSKAINK